MKKYFDFVFAMFYSFVIVLSVITIISFFIDIKYFIIFFSLSFISVLYSLFKINYFKKNSVQYLNMLSYCLDIKQRENLDNMPFPVFCFGSDSKIIWHNNSFTKFVVQGKDVIDHDVTDVIFDFDVKKSMNPNGINCKYDKNYYTAYTLLREIEGEQVYICFLKEDTEIKEKAKLYYNDRVCVLNLVIDNFDEMVISLKESQKGYIINEVENIVENIILSLNGKVNRIGSDKFTAVLSNNAIIGLKNSKFKAFDDIKHLHYETNAPISFSIGIGSDGKSISENNEFAKQAMDMALGRGGDQCVIKSQDDYSFFGESLKSSQKKSKVKARFMTNALVEMINIADNVIIMGHKFADFDSVGSAMGVLRMAKILNKDAYIAIDLKNNVSNKLIDYIQTEGNNIFVDEATALDMISKKTLLIIVDTNAKSLIQYYDIYEKCENIIVIDHHRKVVDHINNATVLYHEPSASSTSEMVTEMLMYFANKYKNADNFTANCLLTGIVLDTKNFSIKTSVRTFDAASYLKQCGADTIMVRKFFSQSSDVYRLKNEILANVDVYKKCGISFTDDKSENLRTVSPQVADEMLQLNGLESSFVVYEIEEIVYISARSFGDINVQLILEQLGGGGHLTMAGAQIKNTTVDEVIMKIKLSIDKYFSEKS
ncbi:MAG: DHH family phosphoesterase [Oscillospiraceae bacterium]